MRRVRIDVYPDAFERPSGLHDARLAFHLPFVALMKSTWDWILVDPFYGNEIVLNDSIGQCDHNHAMGDS